MHLCSTNIAGEQEDRGCLRLEMDAPPLTDVNRHADVGIRTDKASSLRSDQGSGQPLQFSHKKYEEESLHRIIGGLLELANRFRQIYVLPNLARLHVLPHAAEATRLPLLER